MADRITELIGSGDSDEFTEGQFVDYILDNLDMARGRDNARESEQVEG